MTAEPTNTRLLAAASKLLSLNHTQGVEDDDYEAAEDALEAAIAEAEAQPQPINARLLAALKALMQAPCLSADRESYRACPGSKEAVRLGLAAIAEAKAQSHPDRPSYEELLDGLQFVADADTRLNDAQAVANNNQEMLAEELDDMTAVARDLLKRAGR